MKINLNNISLFGYHGVYDEEIENGQNFDISILCDLDNDQDCNDALDNTLDYSMIISKVNDIFNKKRYKLIETLSEDICYAILNYNIIRKVTVSVKKPDAPLEYNLESVEVVCTKKK